MNSINPSISRLFDAYCMAKGITGLELNAYFERIIWESHQMGLTVEDLTAVIRERQKGIRDGSRNNASVLMRNIFGSESTGDVLDEAAALRSRGRVKVLNPAKTSVLRATGRPETTGTDKPAQTAQEVVERLKTGYTEVRKAIGE